MRRGRHGRRTRARRASRRSACSIRKSCCAPPGRGRPRPRSAPGRPGPARRRRHLQPGDPHRPDPDGLRRFPRPQVVVAEWSHLASPLDLWPNVKRLTGFPIARYFQAVRFRRLGRWVQHLSRRALHRPAVDLRAGRPCDDGRPGGARPLCRAAARGYRSDAIHGRHAQGGVGIHARSADAATAAGRLPQARRAEQGSALRPNSSPTG